jgi:prepilin peptidase CpaA
MLATVVLLGLLLVATGTDLLRHKIYNWTTYPGILAALCLNIMGAVLLANTALEPEQLERSVGYVGLRQSLIGLLACGLLMLVCYVMLKIGGGDVKLMAMIGAFLGLEHGIVAMLWTFVFGMCLALIVLIWRVGPLPLLSRVFRQIMWTLRLGRWNPLTEDERKQLQSPLFLAPCALVAVLIIRFQQWGLIWA